MVIYQNSIVKNVRVALGLLLTTSVLISTLGAGPASAEMTDADGNVYKTVNINGQEWMAENLRVSKFRNGDAIPKIIDADEWYEVSSKDDEPAFSPPHKDAEHGHLFGNYYNGYAVKDSRGLCPDGWRIPLQEDVHVLTDNVDHVSDLFSTEVWRGLPAKYDHYPPTNKTGFTALPTGIISHKGVFTGVHLAEHNTNIFKNEVGTFWISDGYFTQIIYSNTFGANLDGGDAAGRPVRCMRD